MRITLDISYVTTKDNKWEPYRLTDIYTESKFGCEEVMAKIQEACVKATQQILSEFQRSTR